MNKLDKQYTNLLQDILDNGVKKSDRTGTGTISVFGRQIRHKMSDGFPLLTTKKMYFKGIVTELLWFLRGDTNIKYLVDNDCHIWDGDAYSNYMKKYKISDGDEYVSNGGDVFFIPDENSKYGKVRPYTKEEFINKIKTDAEFAKKWGELGPVYGKQWRRWSQYEINMPGFDAHFNETQIDQIANLINDLKTNPDSRRLMVNAWNVAEIDQMVLPPCHYGFQVYTRELSDEERAKLMDKLYGIKKPEDRILPWLRKDIDDAKIPTRAISLMWNQRSVDSALGLPFNIASYGLLLEIIAKMVNMVPDELIGNLGDTHIYSNQIDGCKEQIGKLSWEQRKEFLTEKQFKEFGNISPFTDKMIHWWLDCLNIPYSNRMPYPLPNIKFSERFLDLISKYNGTYTSKLTGNTPDYGYYQELNNTLNAISISDIQIENYQSHPKINFPLSN